MRSVDYYGQAFRDADDKGEKYTTYPTAEKLISLQSAEALRDGRKESYEHVLQITIDKFSPADRDAYEAAKRTNEKALDADEEARVQLRVAEDDLAELQRTATTE